MYTHAIKPVKKALTLNPKDRSASKWAGKIYLRTGDYIKAEKEFLNYIETGDDAEADIYAGLAEACLNSRKATDALAYFEIALKLDPENKLALEGKKNADKVLKMASDE